MIYRSKKLLEACRELPCQHCGLEDGTVVAAHSNQLRHGKGRGIKAHDCFVAAMCFKCHSLIDSGPHSREVKQDLWQLYYERTMVELFNRGILVVK